MRILGISAYYHDSAAALLIDGGIIAAAQEERFTRKKHDAGFPTRAITYCLAEARLTLNEIDAVVFYDKPFLKFERLLETYLASAPRGFISFKTAMPVWLKEKLFLKDLLGKKLREIAPSFSAHEKLLFSEHHFSHASSAFFPSPFEEAVVLTMDGVGEWATASLAVGRGSRLEILKEINFPHSLGLLYSAFTYYTGFEVNSGEYKVMGLAPYGQPIFVQKILDHLIDVKPDGSFRLDMQYFNYCTGLTMTNQRFADLFGAPPRKPDSRLTQRDMDLAASIQAVTDDIVLKLTGSAAKETGIANLCLAGGVALNCVANGKVLRAGKFSNLWIQPAAGDAGGALGAALAAHHIYCGNPRTVLSGDAMQGSYLGPGFGQSDAEARLSALDAKFQVYDDDGLIERCAAALADGKAIGWFQGRMEFGPRALGARSILGDARSPTMQKILNLKVKYRESFRPFAPAVLRERVADYFELDSDSPYMLLVASVRHDLLRQMTDAEQQLFGIEKLNIVRSAIPAVTHVDNSARVQTVNRDTNPRFHALISRFEKLTGCAVIVNTSFNVRDEPIVCTPEDAYRCFIGSELDLLVVENVVVRKEDQLPRLAADAPLGDVFIPSRLLACLKPPESSNKISLERISGAFRNPNSGKIYRDQSGVPSLLVGEKTEGDLITPKVKAFYEDHPFPNYEGLQDFGDLVHRGQSTPFAKNLLGAIGSNKLILECGCGTGQLSLFLSLNNNHVLGVDLSASSLKLAVEHKLKNDVARVGFVQMNIFDLAVKDNTFDVVISTGVLHHTRDARHAFAAIARKAKPGGIVVVGLYNWFARLPTSIRSKLIGLVGPEIDYVVRSRIRDRRKAEIWIKDQYYNPHETWHSIDEVLGWFEENQISFLNCFPKILGGSERDLFEAGDAGSKAQRILTQLSWLGSIAAEGALFVMTGRREQR